MSLATRVQESFIRLHLGLYRATGGRLGHRLVGVPSLVLWTVGRRTGATREAVLAYAADGPSFVVVASNGGQDRPPAWLLNAIAQPRVELQVGPRALAATAEVVGPSHPERDRLWTLVNRVNRGRFATYQSRTTRPIDLLRLTPAD